MSNHVHRHQKLARSPRVLLGSVALICSLIVGSVAVPALSSTRTETNGEMGYVISIFHPAIYPGMTDNCPDGYDHTISEAYMASLATAERARLSRPENEQEFARLWRASALGPNNTNICSDFDQFPERATHSGVQGRYSYGFDLDGNDGDSDYTCAHQGFEGPDGERGIDNQSYRALGCLRGQRSPDGAAGEIIGFYDQKQITGERTIVLLLRGVDDPRNDDDVEVIIASSLDEPITNAQGRFVHGATFTVIDNPRWRNVLRGRIENGVLTTTTPETVALRQPVIEGERGPRMQRNEWNFERARLQLTLQPDGSLSGYFAGYTSLWSHIDRSVSAGTGSTHVVNYDCAAAYNTLQRFADGGRDPATGQCTKISTTFEMVAQPAYIVDRPIATTEYSSSRMASARP